MAGLPVTEPALQFASPDIPALVVQALYDEVRLTPKPGLVDSLTPGAHRDMDYALFVASIEAIAPWFSVFWQVGYQHAGRPASEQLRQLRPAGLACEQDMFKATGGVNTHKGGIFALGLLCCAAGRLAAQARPVTRDGLCRQVSAFCHGLVHRELVQRNRGATVGERLYQRYGLAGARGEAESGFRTVVRHVLPGWRQASTPERRLHLALLRLMAVNPDTNLVSRGGLDGLTFVQAEARRLLAKSWSVADLAEMDNALTARYLSPGGSADLLSVAMVLAAVPPGEGENADFTMKPASLCITE